MTFTIPSKWRQGSDRLAHPLNCHGCGLCERQPTSDQGQESEDSELTAQANGLGRQIGNLLADQGGDR